MFSFTGPDGGHELSGPRRARSPMGHCICILFVLPRPTEAVNPPWPWGACHAPYTPMGRCIYIPFASPRPTEAVSSRWPGHLVDLDQFPLFDLNKKGLFYGLAVSHFIDVSGYAGKVVCDGHGILYFRSGQGPFFHRF